MSLSDEINTDAGLVIHQWAAAFNDGDSHRAAALYDPEAVLWGTVWPTLLATPAGIRQYFERAFAPRPQPSVALGERRVRVYGNTARGPTPSPCWRVPSATSSRRDSVSPIANGAAAG
jgi:hypothetical protein